MSTDTKQVYAGIAEVMGELARVGISKDSKNAQQGFMFRGIDDVYNALAPLLSRHKLLMLPEVLKRDVTERTTKNGGVLFYVVLEVKYSLVSAVDGSTHEVKVVGEAMDSGDKATNKAMSAAFKYACLQIFCIPTQANEDADLTTHELSSMMPQSTYDELKQMVKDSGGNVEKWEAYIHTCYPRGVPVTAYDILKSGIEEAKKKREAQSA